MTKIKGRELEKEELVFPPLQMIFLRSIKVIGFGMIDFHISTLVCQDKKQIGEVKVEIKDKKSYHSCLSTQSMRSMQKLLCRN